MNLPASMRASRQKAKVSFFHVLVCGLPIDVPETTPQQSNLGEKIPHRMLSCLDFYPDVVRLTAKMSHHTCRDGLGL